MLVETLVLLFSLGCMPVQVQAGPNLPPIRAFVCPPTVDIKNAILEPAGDPA